MSQQALNEFFGRLSSDAQLRAAMSEGFADRGSEIALDDVIAFAGTQGYEFTAADMGDELTDDALEGVAGGVAVGNNFEEVKVTYIQGIKVTYMPNNFEEVKVTYTGFKGG